MTRRLIVRPLAEREIAAAAEWYEGQRLGLGIDFMAAVDAALHDVLEHPEAWPVWRADRSYRRRVVGRFPFVIFFMADQAEVVVWAVAHAKRRPGYWLRRP